MGFNTVYKSLQELFPQIDARVLRAVAIEHSKDPDAAVEAVLEEIIPFFTERSRPSSPLAATSLAGTSKEGQAGCDDKDVSQQHLHEADTEQSDSFYDASEENQDSENKTPEAVPEQIYESNIKFSADMSTDIEFSADMFTHFEPVKLVDELYSSTPQDEVSEIPEVEESTSVGKYTENCPITLSQKSSGLNLENHEIMNVGASESLNLESKDEDSGHCIENDFGVGTSQHSDQEKSSSTGGEDSVDKPTPLTIYDQSTLDSTISCVDQPEAQGSLQDFIEASLSSDDTSMISTIVEVVDADYESMIAGNNTTSEVVGTSNGCTLDSFLSRSNQIHLVDLIDESIAVAKDNKKILFTAMESVIKLMKELENKEQAADLVEKEAAMGGAEDQNKAEELKKMLRHAKATNDMHAGEVYGEKAILATELRELQSRVLSLSDEKDKSLTVLDEMRQALQVRLAAAENKIKSAEQERLEKEKAARNALAEQELIMEEVVQESNKLKRQAEENAKLQELLVDRGHILDAMQGELAVICQDVILLKENFDMNVPFSKSVSSSQTSCKLASSSSSLRSPVPEQETERSLGLEIPMDDLTFLGSEIQRDDLSGLGSEIPMDDLRSFPGKHEDKGLKDVDDNALLDDGWDVLDHDFEREST